MLEYVFLKQPYKLIIAYVAIICRLSALGPHIEIEGRVTNDCNEL